MRRPRGCFRADRMPGVARHQYAQVRSSQLPTDYPVETTDEAPAELAASIAHWLAEDPDPVALRSGGPARF